MAEVHPNEMEAATPLVVELNDLLAFDLDAAGAYEAALERLESPAFRLVIERFAEDHARHADELTRLVRGYDGRPAAAAAGSDGPFTAAVRSLRSGAGDREVILALKAGERAGRDRYRRAAQRGCSPEVAAVLRRASNDEAAHYVWALETLDDLAIAASSLERAVGAASARLVEGVRAVDRRTAALAGGTTRRIRREVGAHPLRSAIFAVSLGLVAAAVVGARPANGV
ncbi:MAG TPA: ferritin-like domain-containing protein [Gemmatimonadaceae bacterium]|nr:ferritin-like domain-containing protein [Gemmatimonadaceae bacterium]